MSTCCWIDSPRGVTQETSYRELLTLSDLKIEANTWSPNSAGPYPLMLPSSVAVTIFSCRHHPAISSSDIWQSIWDEETPFAPMIVRPRPPSHRDMLVKAKTPGRDVSTRRTTTSPPPEAGTSSDAGAPPT